MAAVGVKGFKLQYDDEYYRIVGPNGEEGEDFDVGSPAYLKIGKQMYMAFLDIDPDIKDGEAPDPETQEEPVPANVYLLGPAQVTSFEQITFERPKGEGEEEEVEEGEEEEEEGEPDDEEEDDDDEVEVESDDVSPEPEK